MNCHQVLTGAVNSGDNCYSVGSVEGIPFVAYSSGCNVVIQSSGLQRVQIIAGILYGNIQVNCLDCSTDVGKIGAAYGHKISVFEPTPLLHQFSSHKLDYKWIQTAVIETDSEVSVISWNLEGNKLLTGGHTIQMWHLVEQTVTQTEGINFKTSESTEGVNEKESESSQWHCVWQCRTSTPVHFLRFSPDGALFVSAGKSDRLVKIWYESAAKNAPIAKSFLGRNHENDSHQPNLSSTEIDFSFIYIAHPRAVTGISWRKVSKYMPRGSVANMLVTSCRDNICRLWVQTLLPEDGLVNLSQIEGLSNYVAPRAQTQRHRQKIMQRLKQMKSLSQFKKRQQVTTDDIHLNGAIPTLPSTFSVHDFHSFGIHGTAMAPGLHFHLTASINAETDIPLVPSLANSNGTDSTNKPSFVVHWLNNKDMFFTQSAEKILREISLKIIESEMQQMANGSDGSDTGEADGVDTDPETDGASITTAESNRKFRKPIQQTAKRSSKQNKALSPDEVEHEESHPNISRQSFHTTSSSNSLATEMNAANVGNHSQFGDLLDRKLEALIREWHSNTDLLFSIHPLDGSLLVWLIEWLDESSPCSFRQPQISFSSRIPNAIPLGDAATMSHNISLYSPHFYLDLKSAILPKSTSHESEIESKEENKTNAIKIESTPFTVQTPTVCLLTKHINGSLNLWNLGFAEGSHFTQVLSISHSSRVCGHRFRVNDVNCHPVLPLLLTTSHHNLPGLSPINEEMSPESSFTSSPCPSPSFPYPKGLQNTGFCSELILWRVDAVGPLSKSGGVTELARINSLELSAFSNVAWVPTLLPSTTLGSISNSPSACFVASDGRQLRLYQAVIDARTLLAEVTSAERKFRKGDISPTISDDSTSSEAGQYRNVVRDSFRVVSLQSTARPGCILELNSISDAVHDWKNTQLLHVFQEQLIRGDSSDAYQSWSEKQMNQKGLVDSSLGAVVDLRHSAVFEEPFYLVVIEKNENQQSVLHMWRLLIASQHQTESSKYSYVPDSNIIQENSDHSNTTSRSNSPDLTEKHENPNERLNQSQSHANVSPLRITTEKVCTQVLPLPPDVEVIHATPAAGHLSSSNIYPACFAPYLIVTACSDGRIRFWRCNTQETDQSNNEYQWAEWQMLINKEESSAFEVPGLPLYVSCAYTGRVACAYKQGKAFSRPNSRVHNQKYINVTLAIIECESTGGSEWVLEDTIHIKNIPLPQTDLNLGIDLEPLIDTTLKNKRTQKAILNQLVNGGDEHSTEHRGTNNLQRLLSVPSYTTMQSLKKIIAEKGNQFTLTQKSLVQLDWVSTEDGSHILTVSAGSKITLFTPVSTDIAQANLQAMKTSEKTNISTPSNRMLLKQASSMAPLTRTEEIRWMTLRSTDLVTADGLPPLPMELAWVRDGILVVGMDNEMLIYTQWKSNTSVEAIESTVEITESRVLTEQELLSHAQESSQLRLPSHPTAIPRSPSFNKFITSMNSDNKKTAQTSQPATDRQSDHQIPDLSHLPDFGIFETSRLACPVLPQYHPKQLMELLAFGKIQRVRAILGHLVACLASMNSKKEYLQYPQNYGQSFEKRSDSERSPRSWLRSRTLSVAAPTSPLQQNSPHDSDNFPVVAEEVQLDYTEITSIRPLPLYALIEADERNDFKPKDMSLEEDLDYDNLFDSNFKTQVEETLDEILGKSAFTFNPKPRKAVHNEKDPTNFGLRQARVLTKLLTHSHLPGLSSLDQMHLLALADSVASFNPNANKVSIIDDSSSKDDSGNESIPVDNTIVSADSLDNCGLRFLLTMRQHIYLLRCLPLVQRKGLQKSGLGTHNIVWAFHSETQEELVQMISSIQRDGASWSELREIGVGLWVRNNALLRKLIEKLAKAAFLKKNDPLDAALYYLMMKKKSLVWGLFRSVGDRKMTDFFQNNFSDDKWRKSALKNAYALMGKQRFEHAAAFFLLAGAVWDAVEVCLSNLDDLQLAMVVIRLYDGDIETIPENLKRLLFQEVLGRKRDGSDYKPSDAHPDPFLRSMAYWMLQDYNTALTTLLEIDVGTSHSKYSENDIDSDGVSVSPSVFNFYLYLRTQPLIVRRQFAQNIKEKQSTNTSRGLIHETTYGSDTITPFERRLFFLTAHSHFRAGCPSLALEVLSRLPNRIETNERKENDSFNFEPIEEKIEIPIATGALPNGDIDGAFDWGMPSIGLNPIDTSDFQFSVEPCSDDEDSNDGGLEMKIKDVAEDKPIKDQNDNKEIKLDIMAQQLKFIACLKILMEELSTLATGFEVDGGQLRYHLYVWLEKSVQSLKSICNYRTFSMRHTFEDKHNSSMVLGNSNEISPSDRFTPRGSHSEGSGATEAKPSLHEILLADKMDFEAKLDRSSRRKLWLTSNEALMRTLLSYCSLHGAHGGGLSSVRMELILLLQELQQERSQQQLLSPLPFPTTLPLLAASVACQKTVIADPIRHLQSVTHDILSTVLDMTSPPLAITPNYSLVYVLRDLGISLSSCIYQSLCDSDAITSKPGTTSTREREDLTSSVVFQNSHLLAGHQTVRRNVSTASDANESLTPITAPNKWPGVQSLRALLARDKDEDSPKLHTLLCEAFVAVYLSQLIYSSAACDSYVMYRLIGMDFSESSWSQLFGGGAKKLIHVATGQTTKAQPESQQSTEESVESSSLDLFNTLSKQRMKLHMKILQQLSQADKPIAPPNIKEDRPTYREQFIPPQTSMISHLMTKPILPDELIHIDYDSSESVLSEDENQTDGNECDDLAATDSVFADSMGAHHGSNPIDEKKLEQELYAWGIIRLCVMRLARNQLIHFLSVAGIELPDLPTTSPLIHSIFKILNNWTKYLTEFMNEFNGPPHHFLTNTYVEASRVGGPAIHKYKALLEVNNTPFRDHNTINKASKRLWNYLVRQERVQDVFIRYIFGKPKTIRSNLSDHEIAEHSDTHNPEPTRIVHKDQENISAFCINRTNHGLIAISTPKEIQEMDISKLLEPVPFLEDEAEYDILNLQKSPESLPSIDYLLVQHPADKIQSSPGGLAIQSSMISNTNVTNASNATQTQKNPIMTKHHFPGNTSPHFCQYIFERSRHVFRPLKRHKTEGVRRLCSHPMLPLYLSGSQDGSVTLWEWNHQQAIANPRPAGTFAKVTRVGFNQQGNKFGVTDSDGNLSLWQVVNTQNKPFFSIQCHSKHASDFTFLGASSLVMTAGQSADHKNIALWDTLLPQKKCLVTSFACHEHNGASAILYAPLNQLLITGGKKGDVFVFDMRQRVQRDRFQAHDSAVKCMALDPQEEFFVTGSADGDIKVWGLGSVRILFYSFPGEHSRSTLFRNIGMGVSHLYVDQNGRLFSCGADGSMKFRQLPDRGINNIIKTI